MYTIMKKDWVRSLVCTNPDTSFPDKIKKGVAEPDNHVVQIYFILLMHSRGQSVEP
jgi:hypothetical protein